MQYINIPLGLKLKTNEIGYFTFYANLGLDAGINIKALGTSNMGDFDQECSHLELNNKLQTLINSMIL